MDFTICYVEVFDVETNRWEYVAKSNEPEEINHWYNNLEAFFEEHNLIHLFIAIENEGQSTLFNRYKGLPADCSKSIIYSYNFYFEEVNMCQNASYLSLSELCNFEYDKTINLKLLRKKDLKLFYPKIYSSKKEAITHKEWLGENYFIELLKVSQRFVKYPECRIVYFLYDIDIE